VEQSFPWTQCNCQMFWKLIHLSDKPWGGMEQTRFLKIDSGGSKRCALMYWTKAFRCSFAEMERKMRGDVNVTVEILPMLIFMQINLFIVLKTE